jgi:hypothetical protein
MMSAFRRENALHKLADRGLVVRTPGGAMTVLSDSMEKSALKRSASVGGGKNAIDDRPDGAPQADRIRRGPGNHLLLS